MSIQEQANFPIEKRFSIQNLMSTQYWGGCEYSLNIMQKSLNKVRIFM